MAYPSPRSIQHALSVLERLPAEALADLAEALIDRLDAASQDPDLEAEEDCCSAEDDNPGRAMMADSYPIGAEEDAEENGDAEPTIEDRLPKYAIVVMNHNVLGDCSPLRVWA